MRPPPAASTPSLLLSAAAALAGLADALAAQDVAGRVLGFAAEPAASVVVGAYDAHRHVLGEVVTDADGRFEFAGSAPVASLRLQHEGVVIEMAVAEEGRHRLEATFAGAAHFTLRGHVVDPAGSPARGMDLICRDERNGTLATITTDQRGAFAVRMGSPVADLFVDPLGWQHVEEGPFTADRGVAIDLRLVRDRYFAVRGRVLDARGAAMDGARVTANDGRRVAWTIADRDGSYLLWANRGFRELIAAAGFERIRLAGQWTREATADLDARSHGLALVTGRFLDRRGRPIAGAALFVMDKAEAPPREAPQVGTTDEDGRFCVRIQRTAPFLCLSAAVSEEVGFAAGPWSGVPVVVRAGR